MRRPDLIYLNHRIVLHPGPRNLDRRMQDTTDTLESCAKGLQALHDNEQVISAHTNIYRIYRPKSHSRFTAAVVLCSCCSQSPTSPENVALRLWAGHHQPITGNNCLVSYDKQSHKQNASQPLQQKKSRMFKLSCLSRFFLSPQGMLFSHPTSSPERNGSSGRRR